MGVIAEILVYVFLDVLLIGLAAFLLPILTFGRARVAVADAPGAFPFHGFRWAEDGRLEVGRPQAGVYTLLLVMVLLAGGLSLGSR